jgi:hypothetical protein
MPSLIHDALVQLFRNRPSLAPELLRDVLHTPVPAFDHVRIGDAALTEVVPTEHRADLVLLLEGATETTPAAAVIVEAAARARPRQAVVVARLPDESARAAPLQRLAARRDSRCSGRLLGSRADRDGSSRLGPRSARPRAGRRARRPRRSRGRAGAGARGAVGDAPWLTLVSRSTLNGTRATDRRSVALSRRPLLRRSRFDDLLASKARSPQRTTFARQCLRPGTGSVCVGIEVPSG